MKCAYKYSLLIERYKDEITDCISKSQYTLIKGPTGCGKSTYVPLLLNDKNVKIAIIEPRRIAVLSLYNTLSTVTKKVGYRMRFNKKINPDDSIVIYTDGAFLNDGFNQKFDYVIIDEVHERSIRTDVILSIIKATKAKVILMSATVDTQKIQKFFNLSVFEIPGISHPVDVRYVPEPVSDYILEAYITVKSICNGVQDDNLHIKPNMKTSNFEKKVSGTRIVKKTVNEDEDLKWLHDDEMFIKESDIPNVHSKSLVNAKNNEMQTNIISKTQKHKNVPRCKTQMNSNNKLHGEMETSNVEDESRDILIFLTGENDINELEKLLRKIPVIKIYKIYSSLSDEDQARIYDTCSIRKVILSTNICETSLTIPGIKYVIDCGLVKTKIYDGISYFGIVPISKESADQRLGRCNRMGPGVCYRLYTYDTYIRLQHMIPEIMIGDLGKPILQLINWNINIMRFKFLDFPPQSNVLNAITFLIDKKLLDENLRITKLGTRILAHPFEIPISCFYQDCIESGLGYYGSVLASLISIDNYNFLQTENDKKEIKVTDIQYLIKLFTGYVEAKDKSKYCKTIGILSKYLEKAHKMFKTLNKSKKTEDCAIEQVFSRSFEYNLSVKKDNAGYEHIGTGIEVFIHPSSNLFKTNEKKIVFVDILYSTKRYTRIVGKYYSHSTK